MAKRQSTLPTWFASTSRSSPKKARLTDESSNSTQSDADQDSCEESTPYADSYNTMDATTQLDETSVNDSQNEGLCMAYLYYCFMDLFVLF